MSAKYFIGIRPQTNEYHTVHKDGCPFLPDAGKRIYLGTFRSNQDAINEGERHFDKSNTCLFCSKEHHSPERKHLFAEMAVSGNLLSIDRFPVTWDGACQCGVN